CFQPAEPVSLPNKILTSAGLSRLSVALELECPILVVPILRVRARISWHFGASAGQADARRRDAGDVVISSKSGNAADACPPPRPAGLRLPRPANHCGLPVMIQLGMGAAAKCQIILARSLSRGRDWLCDLHRRRRRIAE